MTSTATYSLIHQTIETPSGPVGLWRDGSRISGYPESSAIDHWQWEGLLFSVTYKSSETTYVYFGIPFSVIIGLLACESAGKYIASEIKAKYEVASSS